MPKRTNARDGTEQRTLSRTRNSSKENSVAAQEREIHIGDERLTIRKIKIHTFHRQLRAIAVSAPDAAAAFARECFDSDLMLGRLLELVGM